MSISSIGTCSPVAQTQASQYKTAARTETAPSPSQQGAAFVSAIASTLQEIGVSAQDAASSSAADPAQALGDFLGKLMDSLQAQGPGGPPPPPPPSGSSKDAGTGSDLQELIGSISSADSADSDAATSGLQSSFANLLGALGLDSSDASSKLGQFIETLAGKLEASGPSGNLVNTTA